LNYYYYNCRNPEPVYGIIVSPTNGSALTNLFEIDNTTFSMQPYAVTLPNGNVFVTWSRYYFGEDFFMSRVYYPNGSPANDPVKGSEGVEPAVTILSDGSLFLVYIGGINICGQKILASGEVISDVVIFNQVNGKYGGVQPSISTLSDGNIIVTWVIAFSNEDMAIYGRIISPNVTFISDEFLVANLTIEFEDLPTPVVVSLPDGNAVIVYEHSYNIYACTISTQPQPQPPIPSTGQHHSHDLWWIWIIVGVLGGGFLFCGIYYVARRIRNTKPSGYKQLN